MKRFLLISLLLTSTVYSQDINLTTDENIIITEEYPRSTDVKVNMPNDISKYIAIAMVSIQKSRTVNLTKRHIYDGFEESLMNSSLEIINPVTVNISKFRKDNRFLKNEKNEDWLYLYYSDTGYIPNNTTVIILRDYQNKVIYSAIHRNISEAEALLPITML